MYAKVDPDDYDRLNKYKWCAVGLGNKFYAVRGGRRRKGHTRKCYRMHREVIHIPDGMECDHINGNSLDNRKANLRPATHLQNSWNRRKQRQTSGSIYKGLVWDKRLNKWQVRIWVNRKRIYIGSFEDQIEAAKAYDKAAIKYYGEFANLNFET
ncbi:MAG: HNH endonuclease [Planctomycetota bacterium]|jgi:hypothetical protein